MKKKGKKKLLCSGFEPMTFCSLCNYCISLSVWILRSGTKKFAKLIYTLCITTCNKLKLVKKKCVAIISLTLTACLHTFPDLLYIHGVHIIFLPCTSLYDSSSVQ